MATEKQDTDNQDRWKNRYYEALGELEQKEQEWRDAERILRHLVTRLMPAADTGHQDLNRNLLELRSALRDNRDISQLASLIEAINVQMLELDSMCRQAHVSQHPARVLVEALDRLSLPEDIACQAEEFRRQVSRLAVNEPGDEVLNQFVTILKHLSAAEHAGAASTARRQKLLQRILLRQAEQEPAAGSDAQAEQTDAAGSRGRHRQAPKLLAPAVGDLLLQMALRMPAAVRQRINFAALKKHTNRARTRKDLLPVIEVLTQHIDAAYRKNEPNRVLLDEDSVMALAEAVAQFFKQLELPPDLKERVAELEQYCAEHCSDVDSMVHCLNALAEVATELGKRLVFQRDELEGFLLQLSDRLQDLDTGLKKTAALNNARQDGYAQMEAAVKAELQEIRKCIQTSDDPDGLNGAIAARLDAIDHRLHNFAAQQHEQGAQQTLAGLREKLTALQGNGDELRAQLEASRQQTLRDVLTGIPNRQAYAERLISEAARCKRYATPLCMLLLDIDNLTAINDSYGHAAGDRVIRVVAQMLGERVRETDFVARYGGEEFILLMPETALDAATQVADKLRIEIQDTPFHFRDTRVTVTVSAGVAQYQADEPVGSLFERTDAALYKAKEAGRNRIKAA